MIVTLGQTTVPSLDSMTCPAVAVEVAPEKSADKKSALNDPDYQARVAAALAAALLEWRTEAQP